MKKKPIYKSLYVQVIAAIIIGVLLGHFSAGTGEAMKPLGDGFIKLIKMMIAPIISHGGSRHRRYGGHEEGRQDRGLALLYFEILSTIALIVGLSSSTWSNPERA